MSCIVFTRFSRFGTFICSTARWLIRWLHGGGCVRPRFKIVQYNLYWTVFQKLSNIAFREVNIKRKPPCISGMELVSLSCNRVLISAESLGRGWCKTAIATKWYQFHTTDRCRFLFMPWMIDQYTYVRYSKLVNEIGTAVAKVITFSIMTT